MLNPGIAKENIDDKGIVLDLLAKLGDGTMIDLEMQVERRKGFRKRALFYLSRGFTSQLERGQAYFSLRPAALIVLCYEETTSARLHSVYKFLEIHDHRPFSDDLAIHLIELAKLDRMTAKEEADEEALIRWAKFFAASTDEELEAATKGDKTMEKAMDFLEKLSAKPDVRLQAERREMAHLMYRMELTETREEALAEGEQKGQAKGKRDVLLMVLEKNGTLTDEQRQRVETCSDLERLDEWIRRAVDGEKTENILG